MSNPRLIAFYLPQFHPIPENDKWWGKGFTEWTNVVKAKPRFTGHYQPHLPSELGFYDLRNEDTRIAQAELAATYGISGFCYHHYWFNGKMLLERPFNEVLSSGNPTFPFCLCWANENWTRRWDGMDNEILMRQDYDSYDAREHMVWLGRAFSDNRYIRIDDKPLFLIYKADSIPKLHEKISTWQEIAREFGYPGLYLCSVKSYRNQMDDNKAFSLGFAAVVDFKPNGRDLPPRKLSSRSKNYIYSLFNGLVNLFRLENSIKKLPITYVHDYEVMVRNIIKSPETNDRILPCVMPSWDNTPRSKVPGVIQNNRPEIYQKWLEHSLEKVKSYPEGEQIVFINAWNEWAEGCHLEPDLKNGRAFLEATARALRKWR